MLSEILKPYKKGNGNYKSNVIDYKVKFNSWCHLHLNKIGKCAPSSFTLILLCGRNLQVKQKRQEKKRDTRFMRWYIQNGKSIRSLKSLGSCNFYSNVWYNYYSGNCASDCLQILPSSNITSTKYKVVIAYIKISYWFLLSFG